MFARLKPYLIAALVIGYVALGMSAVNFASSQVTSRYFDLIGTKALDIAKMAVSSYEITDAEVAELKTLDFRDVLAHPANIRLNALFAHGHFSKDIKYAYIFIHLQPGEEKYTVPPGQSEHYDAPEGAPLNVLYLVDAIVNLDEQDEVAEDAAYYDDINRYSTLRPDWHSAHYSREATYLISHDEYGEAFSGTLPVYSLEGTYIGNMGIDIYYEDFISMVKMLDTMLSALFMLPSVLLSIFYISVYRRKSRAAGIDPLTGLYNRRYLDMAFSRYLKKCVAHARPLAVLMIDIDWFKSYNDTYGHQQGDVALVSLANAAKSLVRSKQDLTCRFGGEEFLVLLPNTTEEQAVEYAKKIQKSVADLHLEHRNNPLERCVTISQGIYAAIPLSDSESAMQSLIACADKALYTAKSSGRNRFVVYQAED